MGQQRVACFRRDVCLAVRDAGLTVHTNTTLTRTNLEDAAEFPAFVRKELGLAAFSMNLVIPTGSAPLNEGGGMQVRYREIKSTSIWSTMF